MNINGVFPSDFLKAIDLKGRTIKVTIEGCTMEEIGSDKKPVLHFAGKDKGLVLNKTNASMLASAFGPETDAWAGKSIEMRPDKTQFNGQLVDCIRVQIPAPMADDGDPVPF